MVLSNKLSLLKFVVRKYTNFKSIKKGKEFRGTLPFGPV